MRDRRTAGNAATAPPLGAKRHLRAHRPSRPPSQRNAGPVARDRNAVGAAGINSAPALLPRGASHLAAGGLSQGKGAVVHARSRHGLLLPDGGEGRAFFSTFLVEPRRFPRPGQGRRWGGEELSLQFAGGPYRFVGLEMAQRAAATARFGGYTDDTGAAPAAITTVRRIGAAAFRPLPLPGWVYTLELQADPKAVRFAGLSFVGTLRFGRRIRGTFWTSLAGTGLFLEGFENYFRILAAYRLAELGGVLLHSAAVMVDGRAYVFFGPSGSGKTTLAQKARQEGFPVLSDDMNAIAPARGPVVVEKLPFAGELGGESGPRQALQLAGVYRLVKGSALALRPLGRAEALARAAACAPYLNADPYRSSQLLANLSRLLEEVPSGVLTTRRETPFGRIAALLGATP